MNWLDNIIIILIWLFVVFGYSKGLVIELFSFLNWFLSSIIALFSVSGLANILTSFISLADLRFGVAFMILFSISFVIIGWLNDLIISSIGPTRLTELECITGAFFGFIKGSTIIIMLIILSGLTKFPASNSCQESVAINFIKPIITIFFNYLPPDIVIQFNFNP
ncbi:CvpA family protein [Candidatus Halobeggiatoa sp. HSG11]|nr:CvpA family protein [Candidatus Halobeggiatoa sp. HSG11]